MPAKLTTPVLTVDPAKIHEVDTRNAESLHGMWMVFSKCADYMEEGRRLENLSWRLWTLETFCVDHTLNVSPCPSPVIRATNATSEQNDEEARESMAREKMNEEKGSTRRVQEPRTLLNGAHPDGDVPELSSSIDSDGSSDELTMNAGRRHGGNSKAPTAQVRPPHSHETEGPQTRNEQTFSRKPSHNTTTQQATDNTADEDDDTPRPVTSASTSALPSSTSTRTQTQVFPRDGVPVGTTSNTPGITTSASANATSNLRRSQTMMTNTNMSEAAGAAARYGQAGRALYRGKMKHITSKGLEKMVYTIKERKGLEPWLLGNPRSSKGECATAPATSPVAQESTRGAQDSASLTESVSPQVRVQQPSLRPSLEERIAGDQSQQQQQQQHTRFSTARPAVDNSSAIRRAVSSARLPASRPSTMQRTFSPFDFSEATLRHEAATLHPSNRTSSSFGSTGLGLGLGPSVDLGFEDEDVSEEAIRDSPQTASEANSVRSQLGRSSTRNSSHDSADRNGIVRGFMPGHISSYTSATQLAPPPTRQTTLPTKGAAVRTAPASPAGVSANVLPPTYGQRCETSSRTSPPKSAMKSDARLRSDGPVKLKPALKSALKRTTTSFPEEDTVRPGSVIGTESSLKGAGSRVRLAPVPVQVVRVPNTSDSISSTSPKMTTAPSFTNEDQNVSRVKNDENRSPRMANAQPQPAVDGNLQNDGRKKMGGMFTLGGSSVEDDISSYDSYEDRLVSNAQKQDQQQQQQQSYRPPTVRRTSGPLGQLRHPGSSDSASGSGSQNVPSPLKNVVFARDQQTQKAAQDQQVQQAPTLTQAQLLAQERERQVRLQAEALQRQRALVEAQQQQQQQLLTQQQQARTQAGEEASASSSAVVSENEDPEAEGGQFESAIDSESDLDDDSSVIDESDIDDDDEWEDSVDDSASVSSSRNGRTPAEDKDLFRRVDSRKNIQLASHRSLLTMMMNRPQRVVIPGMQQPQQPQQLQDATAGSSGVTVIPSIANSKSTPALRKAVAAPPGQIQQMQKQDSNNKLAKDVLQQAGGYGDEDAIASSSGDSDGEGVTLAMRRKSNQKRQPQPPQAVGAATPAAPADVNANQNPPETANQQGVSPNSTLAPTAIPFALPPRAAMAHSPRTTRRNMLASELTESLRHHLLWERQQKGGGIATMNNSNLAPLANANLPRRHTTQDVSRLTEYPKPDAGISAGGIIDDETDYLDDFGGEYHNKGW